jgi:hypothetical protein
MGGIGDGHTKEGINNVDFTNPNSESTKVLAVSATNNNGTYKINDVITITVEFSAIVNVDNTNGTPRILLETGTNNQYANYISGSGNSTLNFTYTIIEGDISSDLAYFSENALELNGGTINDVNGIYASLLLSTPGTSNSLSDNKEITIDGIRPFVTIDLDDAQTTPTNNSPVRFKAVFSENVTGFNSSCIEYSTSTANPTNINITGTGADYIIEVTGMTQNGTVIVNIPADKVTDDAGNYNVASTNTENLVVYNAEKPTVIITLDDAQTTPTNNSPVRFKAVFSENVTGFNSSCVEYSASTANPTNINNYSTVLCHTCNFNNIISTCTCNVYICRICSTCRIFNTTTIKPCYIFRKHSFKSDR